MEHKTINEEPKNDCEDPEVQCDILVAHKLEKPEFTARINSYKTKYNCTNTMWGRYISATDMETKIEGFLCEDDVIVQTLTEPGNRCSNADLKLFAAKAAGRSYKVALFRSILDIHEPDHFLFYKAIKPAINGEPEKDDIIFVVMKTTETNPVYYGDLSSDFPPTIAKTHNRK